MDMMMCVYISTFDIYLLDIRSPADIPDKERGEHTYDEGAQNQGPTQEESDDHTWENDMSEGVPEESHPS